MTMASLQDLHGRFLLTLRLCRNLQCMGQARRFIQGFVPVSRRWTSLGKSLEKASCLWNEWWMSWLLRGNHNSVIHGVERRERERPGKILSWRWNDGLKTLWDVCHLCPAFGFCHWVDHPACLYALEIPAESKIRWESSVQVPQRDWSHLKREDFLKSWKRE